MSWKSKTFQVLERWVILIVGSLKDKYTVCRLLILHLSACCANMSLGGGVGTKALLLAFTRGEKKEVLLDKLFQSEDGGPSCPSCTLGFPHMVVGTHHWTILIMEIWLAKSEQVRWPLTIRKLSSGSSIHRWDMSYMQYHGGIRTRSMMMNCILGYIPVTTISILVCLASRVWAIIFWK